MFKVGLENNVKLTVVKDLEAEKPYSVIEKTTITKDWTKYLVGIYASYASYENDDPPIGSESFKVDTGEDEIATFNLGYTEMETQDKYSDIRKRKSDKEKSKKEKQ